MNILIIGLGSIGERHINAIKSIISQATIFALRSGNNSKKYPDVTDIYHLDEISTINIDFAIISNPTAEHKKTIENLTKYDFPLFIEKPLCSSLDIEDLIQSVYSKGIKTYVACNLRFLDCIRFIKDMAPLTSKKRLNEVNVYCGSYLPLWRPKIDFRNTYSVNPELGGGVNIDLIHELDYLYWIFGIPKEIIRIFRSQSSLSISAIDYSNYILDYNSFCANIVLNYYRRDPKRSLELVFEDETWNVDLLKNLITCNKETIFSSEQRIPDTYLIQMEYFINCLKTNNKTFNNISDAYNVLKICIEE